MGYAGVNKKLVVVAEEAETVRSIFRRYLELGSVAALVQDLDRNGIRTKGRPGAKGRMGGGMRFGVGAVSYLLKNRLYVGEVVYRGEVHRGEHEPILDRDLFEAVQAKLRAGAVLRRHRFKGSPAVLTARIFDDRGNRMSPTHCNKRGVPYRYYVAHPALQGRRAQAGSVPRVPAPEIETLVLDAVRKRLEESGGVACPKLTGDAPIVDDCTMIERHVDRVVVKPQALEVLLMSAPDGVAQTDDVGAENASDAFPATTITLPWSAQANVAVKGIIHTPAGKPAMTSENRDALLTAIAKSRRWLEDVKLGRIASLAEIAQSEGRGERYIRQLASLAFVSPRIVAAIVAGRVPADLTVSSLAKNLSPSWGEQERHVGLLP